MGSPRFLSRRIAAAALATGLALSSLGVGAASAATTTDPGKAAAGWIAAQVASGSLGQGSLADAIFAFASVGAGGDAAAVALSQLEANVDGYILDGSTFRAGALGKTLLAVIVAGGNPNAFGGHDLEAELRGIVEPSGQFAGASISDQAFGVLALAATSAGEPAESGDWLADQQCPSGEYSWDGSCPSGAGSEDPDTTGLVLQALLAAGESAAADASVAWLLPLQDSDGAFASYGTPNTNTTGVAGQALRAAGEAGAADDAAAFVVQLQYGCDTEPASDIGAIAWAQSSAGFLIFSTPQAVLTLGGGPLNELSISGATADAPTFDCTAAPTPTPPNGGEGQPVITPPPTSTYPMPAPAPVESGSLWVVLIVLAAAVGGGLVTAARVGRRR